MNETTVTITLREYQVLARAAEHYKNIARAAIDGASIKIWSGKPELDMDAVDDYLKVAEYDRIKYTFDKLRREHEQEQEEQNA